MKKTLSNRRGYSLVELIIVLAIVAVLAVMSLVSLTILKTARAKDACVKTGSEINELKTKSMNMTPSDTNYDGYALMIYKDSSNGKYHLAQVLHKKPVGGATDAYDPVPGEDVTISSSVVVKFTGYNYGVATKYEDKSPGTKTGSGEDGPLYICFDKRGNCYSGYGTISFYKRNGTLTSKINIGSNGSIDVR